MASSRRASHAGSWYSSSKAKLGEELSSWLGTALAERSDYPRTGCRAIIAPHAGYSYSGPCAAYAYGAVDTAAIKRIFVLGPSHHAYLEGCALTGCTVYETPLGPLTVDQDTVRELQRTGRFETMSRSVDEDEHSIEMHLPYIRKIFDNRNDLGIVPILVGALSVASEQEYGALLAPYLRDPETLFVISSDFCHWGTRFRYTFYYPPSSPSGGKISANAQLDPAFALHESISKLDHEGMEAITFGGATGRTAKVAHDAFAAYLAKTKNTICGRHPIGVMLGAFAALEERIEDGDALRLEWTRYDRSELITTVKDSSVSYASAFVEAPSDPQ